MGHVGGQLAGVGQLLILGELLLHVLLIGHIVDGAQHPPAGAVRLPQLPHAKLVIPGLSALIRQPGGLGEHVLPPLDAGQEHPQVAVLPVPLVLPPEHGGGRGVDQNRGAVLVIGHHPEGQVFHDALVEGLDPLQFAGVAPDALHHLLKGPGQLPYLVRLVQILLSQLVLLAGISADAPAHLAQPPDGIGDVVGDENAGLDDGQQHGHRRQNHVLLFLDKAAAQPLAVQIAPDRPAQSGVLRSSQLLQCAHVRRRIAHEQGAVPAVNKQQVAPVIFPVLVQQPLRLLPVLLQLEVRLEIADQGLRLLALRLHFDLEFRKI